MISYTLWSSQYKIPEKYEQHNGNIDLFKDVEARANIFDGLSTVAEKLGQ